MAPPPTETGKIVDVQQRGWAGDTFYLVKNGEAAPIEVDAYQVGSALLQPGEVVKLPQPKPAG